MGLFYDYSINPALLRYIGIQQASDSGCLSFFEDDLSTEAKNSLPKATEEIKTVIDIEAEKAIQNGLIYDRKTMKKWLMDLDLEITRETKKNLSSTK